MRVLTPKYRVGEVPRSRTVGKRKTPAIVTVVHITAVLHMRRMVPVRNRVISSETCGMHWNALTFGDNSRWVTHRISIQSSSLQ